MNVQDLDPESTEYKWWMQGTIDEAAARDEGLSGAAKELRYMLESIARGYGLFVTRAFLIRSLAVIYCPQILRRRFRK